VRGKFEIKHPWPAVVLAACLGRSRRKGGCNHICNEMTGKVGGLNRGEGTDDTAACPYLWVYRTAWKASLSGNSEAKAGRGKGGTVPAGL